MTKNAKRFVICFCDVATHVIVVSRTLCSSNQHFLCGSELIDDHTTQTNVRFESLTIVVDNVIYCLLQRPWVLESQAYISYFLNC